MSKETEKTRIRGKRRPIPHYTVEESLKIAKAIQEGNNGKPWNPVYIADFVKLSKTGNDFRDLTSSAYKYGITAGTWNAQQIALTDLGQTLTKPTDNEQEILAKQQAVLNIEVFKNIYEHYRDGKLPTAQDRFFKNALETEFKIPKQFVDECIRQLEINGKFSGILFESQGSLWVTFKGGGVTTLPKEEQIAKLELPEISEEESIQPVPPPTKVPRKNQIFIVHGKDRTPLKQLKVILEKFKIPYKVALDEPHGGRPISKKVADLMNECTSAIIIFTADEMYTDSKGNEVWRPSDNAVYELGAASILYDKIVILKEDSVSLASDFSDIGYISFEKDQLAAKAMELLSEFVGFGFVQITPT